MYGTTDVLHSTVWSLRRIVRLSPMQSVMRELRRRGVRLQDLDALEMFGGDGTRHTLDYCNLVRTMEAWELDSDAAAGLKRNLPTATVLNVNSFDQVQATDRTYDLIVADPPTSLFGPDQRYCEHFDILRLVLARIMRPSTILLLSFLPDVENGVPTRKYPLKPGHLARRSEFYGTDHPDRLTIFEMVATYHRMLQDSGFELEWYFHQLRTFRSQVHYLVLKVRREASGS